MPKEALLLKTTSILNLVSKNGKHVLFDYDSEEEDLREALHVMDKSLWVDLGSPTVITLTIEPGDKLN